MWSYVKLTNINYTNNTGSNLEKKPVSLYTLDGKFYKTFSSLSDCAKHVAKIINYTGDWKIIRSNIAYTLQKPTTRKVRQKYKISYIEAPTFNESLSKVS